MNAASQETPAPVADTPSPRTFIDNGDGTVTDPRTGLMWTKPTLTPECVTHAQAEKACAECTIGGHSDWRMPTVEELFLLADRSRYNPAIDTEAFPDTQSDWYWSSTPWASSPDYAWIVGFSNGYAGGGHRDNNGALARAVRRAAPGQWL